MEVGEELDRAILWKKARIPKNKAVDDELAIIHNKIVSLRVINSFHNLIKIVH